MKVSINSTVLLKKLSIIKNIVPTHPTMLILDNFLFKVTKNKLYITASDLQIFATVETPIESDIEDMSIALPSKLLLNTLQNLPDQPIELVFNVENYTTKIFAHGGKEYKIACENAEDFPLIPTLKEEKKFQLSSSTLLKAINYTLFAISNDELKPAMTGIYFDLDEQSLKFIATDGRKLSRFETREEKIETPIHFILPKKTFSLLKNILTNQEKKLDITYNNQGSKFSMENCQIYCRLIEEQFPQYKNVIPQEFSIEVVVERTEFLNSLNRSILYANQSSYEIKLSIEKNNMKITSEDIDFSNAAKEELTCEHQGDDIVIAFNARYFVECISHMNTSQIILKMNGPSNTIVIVPKEEEENESLLMLIVPLITDR